MKYYYHEASLAVNEHFQVTDDYDNTRELWVHTKKGWEHYGPGTVSPDEKVLKNAVRLSAEKFKKLQFIKML